MAGSSLYRLKKDNRLLNAGDYGRVFKKATRSRDNCFIVLSRSNDTDIARLGQAISKKNCRFASGRNRIKRVVRESFRHHQAALAGLFNSLTGHWERCQRAKREKGAQE